MKLGTIYLITNRKNGQKYVGQTARDMWTRFEEHCKPSNTSCIGQAIQQYGYAMFDLTELERVPLEKLDEREKYWIEYYDTFRNGYNQTVGGKCITEGTRLCVIENGYIIASAEEFGRMAQAKVGWSSAAIARRVREVLNTDKTFLSYHFKTDFTNMAFTDYDIVNDWMQTLQIRFCGKHIYCFELQRDFDTIAECGRYLIDNGLSTTTSITPLQSVVTAIGKQLHGTIQYIESTQGPLTFAYLPGTTKQPIPEAPFQKTKTYCPQLDKEFSSITEAAQYMISKKLWTGIKVKTAKLRISNVVNGYFPDYKGYVFEKR